MPRGFPEDTNKQRFLVEVIEKENTSRLRAWHVANTSQVGNTNSDSKSKQFQVINFTYRAAYTLRAVLVALTIPTFCFSSPPVRKQCFVMNMSLLYLYASISQEFLVPCL